MKPFVSVIIPHHLNENQPYLDLAVQSVMSSEGVDFECIVVADTEEPPFYPDQGRPFDFDDIITHHDRSLDNAGKKVNYAIKNLCDQSTTHYLMMSDDVMIAKHTLRALLEVQGDCIQNPMSNSDNGSQFFADTGFPVKLDIKDFKSSDWDKINQQRQIILVPRPWVAFYCTMIPKKLWNKVGELDIDLDYRGNDVDYCRRASMVGAASVINFGAFALHFGDKTIPKCTTAQDLDKCSEAFQKKWNK